MSAPRTAYLNARLLDPESGLDGPGALLTEGAEIADLGAALFADGVPEGIVGAAREVSLHVPLVVRLEGTNVEFGQKILKRSRLAIVSADKLADAAAKIVHSVKEAA